jgi:hypothetical protein
MKLSQETIAAAPFRMGYRVAIAHEYRESNPETFSTYRFPDGTMLKDYIGIAA